MPSPPECIPHDLSAFLLRKAHEYNAPGFIAADPICIPHRFSTPQDIEIAGLFAALLAWGHRTSIIRSCERLMGLMNEAPYAFIMQLHEKDFKALSRAKGFVHRTFQPDDLMHIWQFLHHHYVVKKQASLETAFSQWMQPDDEDITEALNGFRNYVFSPAVGPHLARTYKHIAAPYKKSTCKRLCMYLRWMVRQDRAGVDFGLWKTIQPQQLVLPVDLHVARVARRMGLLRRTQTDWEAALALTNTMKQLAPADPALLDFALFALGAEERF